LFEYELSSPEPLVGAVGLPGFDQLNREIVSYTGPRPMPVSSSTYNADDTITFPSLGSGYYKMVIALSDYTFTPDSEGFLNLVGTGLVKVDQAVQIELGLPTLLYVIVIALAAYATQDIRFITELAEPSPQNSTINAIRVGVAYYGATYPPTTSNLWE
jgi:hypothetical protein